MDKKTLWKLSVIFLALFFVIIVSVRRQALPASAEISLVPISDSMESSSDAFNDINLEIEYKKSSLCPTTSADATSAPATVSNVQPLSASTQTIKVYLHASGKTQSMTVDEYLTGVVAGEMPASFEPEALKAQAVAARTYLMHRLQAGRCGKNGADICTDYKHCQAWLSVDAQKKNWDASYEKYRQKLHDAVYSTSGQVIYYNNEPITALYHSVSGGTTEDCAAVFSQATPYLVSVSSPDESSDSNYKSENQYTYAQFATTINKAFPKAKLSSKNLSAQVSILSHTASGRADQIKLGSTTVEATQLRSALGLKSTQFSISYKDNKIIFEVIGYGHGVGMSQRGAQVMAQRGSTYVEILQHYYVGTSVK